MKRLRWLTVCATILFAAPAPAQLPVPPDVNLFGDDLPQTAADKGGRAPQHGSFVKSPDQTKPAPDYAQVLVFRDRRQLHGQLMDVTRDEVIWRRADTNEALHFPRAAVRRIALFPIQPVNQNVFPGGIFAVNSPANDSAGRSSKNVPATLKLPGGDWLFGEATTADGESFALRLDDGTSVVMHRAQLEWLHFSKEPAPAIGFFGSKLDLDGWTSEVSKTEIAGGTITVDGGDWIGHAVSPPKRFEVALEVPEDAEEGTRLWLQPFGPQVNCYTTGTVEIQFGKKQITRQLFVNRFDRQTTSLPKEATEEKGPVKYRVFYDGDTHRIIVQRNGRKVGDWKFDAKTDGQDNEAQLREMRVTGICFDQQNHASGKLRFNGLRVQPWNGVVPDDTTTADDRDQLTLGDTTPIMGKLESLSARELVFSGETHANKAGVFVKLTNTPAALAAPEAKVHLGRQGEFSARNLEVHDGHVRCDTAFATALEIPAAAVQTISFEDQPLPQGGQTDMLVFKNGDELPGTALAAGTNAPVRWRSFCGQELEIQPRWVAGIRLARTGEARPTSTSATVELRNGERLRGSLVALDEKQLHFQHPQLGPLALDRARLWHLFPSSSIQVTDGGDEPDSWMDPRTSTRGKPSHRQDEGSDPWIHLDGTYILRNGGTIVSTDSNEWRGLQRDIPSNLDRFEIRVEVSSPQAIVGNLSLRLASRNNDLSWQATVSYNEIQLVVFGQQNHRPNWREIPLQDKLTDLRSRRSIRIFVDTKTGTSDLFINGALIAHLGQDAGERLKPEGYVMHFQPYPMSAGVCVLSNLWIGPWTGELPHLGNLADPMTSLSNGDAAPGTPKSMHDGKLAMEDELGAFEIPTEKVQEVDFGGAMLPEQTAGRLRLADGTVMNVADFHWDGHDLTAQSATFGKLHLPAGAVDELVYDPPPPHAPKNPEPKRVAQKESPEENGAPIIRQ